MNQEKSSIATWVAWVALIVGIIAFVMAWMAMNDTNNLRESIEQGQVMEDPTSLPPAPEPMNGTGEPMNGTGEVDGGMPEGTIEPEGNADDPMPMQ